MREQWVPADNWDCQGVRVECARCGRMKKPHGRSASVNGSDYCTDDSCVGYNEDPVVGCLWPGEKASEFGFQCCTNGTVMLESPVGGM